MKKIITILVLLSFIYTKQANAQPPVDTLPWLKNNIEAKSSFFKGKHFNVLLDSLKGYKKAINEYSGARNIGLGMNKVDTIWVDQIKIYFEPYIFSFKSKLHTKLLFNNHFNDTLNTHIKYVKVIFKKPVPFLTKWWSYDNTGLGTIKWNRRLEIFYSKGIIDSVTAGEF